MEGPWWPVVHRVPVEYRRAPAPADGSGVVGGAGMEPAQFDRMMTHRGWREFLFAHCTPQQMVSEVADALYGLHELAVEAAEQVAEEDAKPGGIGTVVPPARRAPFRSFDEVVEGVRRVILYRDPARRTVGVVLGNEAQVRVIAADLCRDAGLDHLVPTPSTHGGEPEGGGGRDTHASVVLRQDVGGNGAHNDRPMAAAYVPLRITQHPSQLMTDMPWWYVSAGIMQAMTVRMLAHVLGVPSRFVDTVHGRWHVYVVDGRQPPPTTVTSARTGSRGTSDGVDDREDDDLVHVPIVVLHGMFTTSVSVLPLALLVAAATRRLVLVPGLLDFDFGFSTSFASTMGRRDADAGGGTGAAASGGVEAGVVTPVSPMTWAGHKDAVTQFITVGVPDLTAEMGMPRVTAVDVVGHSFGGWLAAKVSAASPHLFRKVVLLAPGGLGRYRAVSSAAPLTGRRAGARLLRDRLPGPIAVAAASIFNIIARSPYVVHLVLSMVYDDYFAPGTVVPHECLLLWGTQDHVHRAWANPGQPVSGGGGHTSLADTEKAFLADLPRGSGLWVEGASHALVVDAMLTVADVTSSFLGSASDGASGKPDRSPIAWGATAMRLMGQALGATRPTAPMTTGAAAFGRGEVNHDPTDAVPTILPARL